MNKPEKIVFNGSNLYATVKYYDSIPELRESIAVPGSTDVGNAYFKPSWEGDCLGEMGIVEGDPDDHTVHEIYHLTQHVLRRTKGKAKIVDSEGKESGPSYVEIDDMWMDEELGAMIFQDIYHQFKAAQETS